VGWDWIGMNLFDGSALTAFRLRRPDDHPQGPTLWAGGSWRSAGGAVRDFPPQALRFTPQRRWTSTRHGAPVHYPVQWRIDTPAGSFIVQALLDDQELDSRASTGTVYWEGLSELLDAGSGRRVGLGYLEMTGYAGRLRL
jgi:predicted secreted hydrolase